MKRLLSCFLILICLFSLCSCTETASIVPDGISLAVHFIDVGQADCALVSCGGQNLLIDGGNAGDSSLIYSYLEKYNVTVLDYVIATHPHEDHIGGIPGALSYAQAKTVYCSTDESDNTYFRKLKSKLDEQGLEITVPKAGDSFDLGGASVKFLGPVEYTDDENNNSLVCKVQLGSVSFLFTGDAESPAEKKMLEYGEDLSATVLKVGHHGSEASSCYRFLREVDPDYAVISCEKNNQYGHPSDALLSRLRDSETAICRTDLNGTIIFVTDGTGLNVLTEKGSVEEPKANDSADEENYMYIGNSSSKVYHIPSCRSLPSEEKRVFFYNLEEALLAGYRPCGICCK